jgi:DNA-binding transcriptional ArsR family regulator
MRQPKSSSTQPILWYIVFMGEFKIGVTNVNHKVRNRLLTVPIVYSDESQLSQDEKELLHILEIRSWRNQGHTKIFNDRLAKKLGKSVRTIQRHLKSLQSKGYLHAIVTRRYDERRLKKGQSAFYCDRFFQLNRVFLAHRFASKTQEELGWKQDFRPKLKKKDYNGIVPVSYLIDTEFVEVLAGHTRAIRHVPAWNSYVDLMREGQMSGEMWDKLNRTLDLASLGDENALSIVGGVRRNDVPSQQAQVRI